MNLPVSVATSTGTCKIRKSLCLKKFERLKKIWTFIFAQTNAAIYSWSWR